jgi:hypothetical protein
MGITGMGVHLEYKFGITEMRTEVMEIIGMGIEELRL